MRWKPARALTIKAAARVAASLIVLGCAAGTVGASQPAKCTGITVAEDWPNPFLLVTTTGLVVFLHGKRSQEVPVEQLADYLRKLPKSAWPCGKAVAAQENGVRGGREDDKSIEDNRRKVESILKGLKIRVDWWPSA